MNVLVHYITDRLIPSAQLNYATLCISYTAAVRLGKPSLALSLLSPQKRHVVPDSRLCAWLGRLRSYVRSVGSANNNSTAAEVIRITAEVQHR